MTACGKPSQRQSAAILLKYFMTACGQRQFAAIQSIIIVVKGASQQSLQIIDLNLLMLKSSRKGACPPPHFWPNR